MTKKHFIDAAAIVRNILEGNWTNEPPVWTWTRTAVTGHYLDWFMSSDDCDTDANYTRAVQTAEAFIHLFSAANPRFDTARFLIACGLAEKPAKTKTPRKVRA